jgi:hypothetical protein
LLAIELPPHLLLLPSELESRMPPVYDVFISYRHIDPDKTYARQLLSDLEAAGYKVAIDERDFEGNRPFLQEMERCIEESRFTLSVVTPRYIESGNVEQEHLLAVVQGLQEKDPDQRRRIIPLFFEDVNRLPPSLFLLTGIRFNDPNPLTPPIERLKATLGPPSAPPGP